MKNFFLVFILIFFVSLIVAPYALAECCVCGDGSEIHTTASLNTCSVICNGHGGWDQNKSCQGTSGGNGSSDDRVTLTDPLGLDKKDPITNLFANIIKVLLGFVGIASLVAFIYAGFVFLVSAGSPERVKKAKDTMLYAIIGIFIAMASYAILNFIFSILEKGTGQ